MHWLEVEAAKEHLHLNKLRRGLGEELEGRIGSFVGSLTQAGTGEYVRSIKHIALVLRIQREHQWGEDLGEFVPHISRERIVSYSFHGNLMMQCRGYSYLVTRRVEKTSALGPQVEKLRLYSIQTNDD